MHVARYNCIARFKFNFKTQKCDTKKSKIWPLGGVNFSRFPDEKIPGNGKTKKSDSREFSRSGSSRYLSLLSRTAKKGTALLTWDSDFGVKANIFCQFFSCPNGHIDLKNGDAKMRIF